MHDSYIQADELHWLREQQNASFAHNYVYAGLQHII